MPAHVDRMPTFEMSGFPQQLESENSFLAGYDLLIRRGLLVRFGPRAQSATSLV
jgi:hypothetical protein